MKKIFYSLTVLGALALTACGGDSAPEAWTNISKEPIEIVKGGSFVPTINGEVIESGTVALTAKSATEAVLEMYGMIIGNHDLVMPVTLTEAADGSFTFSGMYGMTDLISRTDLPAPSSIIYTVTAKGSISAEGLLQSLNVTTAVAGPEIMAGKWNLYDKVLMNPETEEIIAAPVLVEWEQSDGGSVGPLAAKFLSSLAPTMLVEYLNQVTLSTDGNILAKYSDEALEVPDVEEGADLLTMIMTLADMHVLNEETGEMDMKPVVRTTWKNSPKGLAYWYFSNDMIYIVPNLTAIMGQVENDQQINMPSTGEIDMAMISDLLAQFGIDLNDPDIQMIIPHILEMLDKGIPFKYNITADGTFKLYIDKQMAEPYMKLIIKILPNVEAKLAENPETNEVLQMVLGMFELQSLADMENVWAATTKFNLGLTLKR